MKSTKNHQPKNNIKNMSKLSILAELWNFLKERKKWWLLPIVIFLVLLGSLIVLTQGSALAPFIYAIF
jgi:hypothetical protein